MKIKIWFGGWLTYRQISNINCAIVELMKVNINQILTEVMTRCGIPSNYINHLPDSNLFTRS